MLMGFKALTRKLNKAYKKGQWKRFIVSFLILALLGLLSLADGWASSPEALKKPINAEKLFAAEKIYVAGGDGAVGELEWDTARITAFGMTRENVQETIRDSVLNIAQKMARENISDKNRDSAADVSAARASTTDVSVTEAVVFQDMVQVSGADLDRGVIYAWGQVPQTSENIETEKRLQNLAAHCRQNIMERIQVQNPAEYSAGSYLMETKQGEFIKTSTRHLGGASPNYDYPEVTSDYLLVEVSQITSVERAVLLRQLVTQALGITIADAADDLADGMEPGGRMTNGIDSEAIVLGRIGRSGTEWDGIEANGQGTNGIKLDGTEPNGIKADVTEPDSIESDATKLNSIKADVTKLDGPGLNGIEPNCIEANGTKQSGIKSNGIEAVPVKSSLNLTLSHSGHLTQDEQLKLVERMLATAGAGNSQGLNSSELISLTAYTPRLSGCEILAGEPVNLQIASRYHSLDNRTYFQIGAPLLMIEY